MKLHIVIPYHGEEKELYYPLFQSINNQEDFDFNNLSIYIGRSDGETLIPDFSGLTNIENRVTFISKKCAVSGPGQSRQLCVDWIMKVYYANQDCGLDGILYFDCDDIIVKRDALSQLFNFIKYNPTYGVLRCKSYQFVDGKIQDIEPDNETHNVWSKVYRAQIIKDYHIEFPSDIKYNEDYVYNYCVNSVPNIKVLNFNFFFYQWNRRDTSTSAQGSYSWTDDKSIYYIKEGLQIFDYYTDWRKKYLSESTDTGFNYMRSLFHLVFQVDQANKFNINIPDDLKTEIRSAYQSYLQTVEDLNGYYYNYGFLINSINNWLANNS